MRAPLDTLPLLITIPISHYCEKVRWALDRSGLRYREEPHLQIFHYLAVRRAGGGISVPTLVTPDGTLRDSTDILKWIDGRVGGLYPTDARDRALALALEDGFDERLGPPARRLVYIFMLERPDLAYRYNCHGVPSYERRLLPFIYPIAQMFLSRRLALSRGRIAEDVAELDRLFKEVGARLEDGRRYLMGEKFGAVDLTFASLAAPMLLPSEYAVPLPRLEEVPRELAELVKRFRSTAAGQFVMRLFAEERSVRGPSKVENGQ